ncbi:MAG: PAS domain-containing sensor histidine kinase [Bacteroidales bacterium]|jgi:PAS domain S-box-containing protein
MIIDIRTLGLVIGLVGLLLVIVLLFQFSISREYHGLGWWVLGLVATAASVLLMLLRDFISIRLIYIILANFLFVSGMALIYTGVRRFFGKKENIILILLILFLFLGSLAWFSYAEDNIGVRSALVGLVMASFSIITSISLFYDRPSSIRKSANFTGFVLAGFGLVYLIRAADALFVSSITGLFDQGWFQIYGFLAALIADILLTYGLIFMVNQRLQSEYSEARETLAKNQRQYDTFMNSTPDIAYLKDDQFRYRMVNNAQVEFFNMPDNELLGKTDSDLMAPENADRCHETDRQVLESGKTMINFETVGNRVYETRKFPVQLANGKTGVGAYIRDITDQKLAEQEVEIKKQQLEQLVADKDRLFSIIAHDLRSPFNALLGLTEIMADDKEACTLGDMRKSAGIIRKSANVLNRQLGNLLEWSRIQMNAIAVDPVWLNLKLEVESEIELLAEAATQKKISVTSTIGKPIRLMADKQMLHSILRNLIANAIKFTKAGGAVTIAADEQPEGFIRISVKDTGIGMSKDVLSKIFELNSQGYRRGTEGEPSSGLGLIISRQLVEKQGGQIWAESEEGNGSTFFFLLKG